MVKMWFAGLACLSLLVAQDRQDGQLKHLSALIVSSFRPFELAAIEIQRGVQYPSVIHLKGAVEIKIPMCVGTGQGNAHSCAGEVVVRADEAELHEDTGQIEGKGMVTITRKCEKCPPTL